MSNRYRFPPSPTGHLHVGNVRTALYNWLLARKDGGTFVLRIEDTDAERSTRESEDALLRDLEWLGLDWDEGPGIGGPYTPYRQSERETLYQEYTKKLLEGGQAYYCFCSPDELKAERERALAEGRPPRYSGKCRSIAPDDAKRRINGGETAAVRFRVEEGSAVAWDDLVHGTLSFEREIIGDFVIVRSEGLPAYNYAVVLDDALMRINRVLRGDDHISNTPRQILIYEALGFPTPRFGHLPMILGPDGSRLSKRHGATSVDEFRRSGYLPEALINYLALLGWNPGDEREAFTLGELVEVFSTDRINKSAATFNIDKLGWLNGQHMRSLPAESVFEHALPFLLMKGFFAGPPQGEIHDWALLLTQAFAGSAASLKEIAEGAALVFEFDAAVALADPETGDELRGEGVEQVLTTFLEESRGFDPLDVEGFRSAAKAVGKRTGVKGRGLFHPLRVAITGCNVGPELDKLVPLLEAGKGLPLPKPVMGVRERIEATVKHLREG
ncbi:MAG TPA: glutamate--tRNA ligase [Acidobacteriota bacterium]|nr:glutamate--tRNA ligase [Acidobacteriota bacterium]